MNAFKRASLKLSHAVKHKTLSGGSTEEIVDEALEKRLTEHKAYEEKVKTLQALTLDARAQLGEVFLQIGNAAQCVEQLSDHQLDPASARATRSATPMAEKAWRRLAPQSRSKPESSAVVCM